MIFNPVCNVNYITFNALFSHSVKQRLSSMLAIIKFFNVFNARTSTPVPVCSLGVLYSISIYFSLQKFLYFLETNAPTLSVLVFSGCPYKLMFCGKKFKTSFVSDDLQIFTVGHLLNLSITISIWCSPFSLL